MSIVKNPKGNILSHQESLKEFLIEEVVKRRVLQIRTANTKTNHSYQHAQQKEDKSEDCPYLERLFHRPITIFLPSSRPNSLQINFLFHDLSCNSISRVNVLLLRNGLILSHYSIPRVNKVFLRSIIYLRCDKRNHSSSTCKTSSSY